MNSILKVEELKKSLYEAINNSEVSIVNAYYVVKDLFKDITISYNDALRQAYEEDGEDIQNAEAEEESEE